MRKFLTFLFGAVFALCFLGCPNTTGGANSNTSGANKVPPEVAELLNEKAEDVTTDKTKLPQEQKTILDEILTALKNDTVYTSLSEKPNFDKINLYESEFFYIGDSAQRQILEKKAYLILTEERNNKCFLAIKIHNGYTFEDYTEKIRDLFSFNFFIYDTAIPITTQKCAKYKPLVKEISTEKIIPELNTNVQNKVVLNIIDNDDKITQMYVKQNDICYQVDFSPKFMFYDQINNKGNWEHIDSKNVNHPIHFFVESDGEKVKIEGKKNNYAR